jgi:hypothetical protein
MALADLRALSVNELVDRFATTGVAQYKALDEEDGAGYKKLFYQMVDVQKELKGRLGDERRALVLLFDYPNMQVRLMAAKYALTVIRGRMSQSKNTLTDRVRQHVNLVKQAIAESRAEYHRRRNVDIEVSIETDA